MNNENNELLNNDVEINVSEENIILAPPVELFDEAKEIAQSTLSDEKFPFSLQYTFQSTSPYAGDDYIRRLRCQLEGNFNPRPPTRGTT